MRCPNCGNQLAMAADGLTMDCVSCPYSGDQVRWDEKMETTVPDFHQAIGAIPLKPGMPTATEAIRQAREEDWP